MVACPVRKLGSVEGESESQATFEANRLPIGHLYYIYKWSIERKSDRFLEESNFVFVVASSPPDD